MNAQHIIMIFGQEAATGIQTFQDKFSALTPSILSDGGIIIVGCGPCTNHNGLFEYMDPKPVGCVVVGFQDEQTADRWLNRSSVMAVLATTYFMRHDVDAGRAFT